MGILSKRQEPFGQGQSVKACLQSTEDVSPRVISTAFGLKALGLKGPTCFVDFVKASRHFGVQAIFNQFVILRRSRLLAVSLVVIFVLLFLFAVVLLLFFLLFSF